MVDFVSDTHAVETHKEQLLTDGQVRAIAQRLNEKINLPILKEGAELKIFIKVVRKIDRLLYNLLPNEIYELVHDATDGIDHEELQEIKRRIIPLINKAINLPFISERREAKLIGMVLDIIFTALEKEHKLKEA
ncbi:MAG: hypothetical protein ACEPOZ_15390 [Marinifilaceae bacterium]